MADFHEAGTMQYAELRPQLAASLFPSKSKSNPEASEPGASRMNISRRRSRTDSRAETDEFGGDMLDDGDLLAAGTKPSRWYLLM